MDGITVLQECVVKVEEIKDELCNSFENGEDEMLGINSDKVNASVAVIVQTKAEMEEAEEHESKPIATMFLFPMEEEQLEDPLAVDPLADCGEWNEKNPLADSLLLRVKREEAAEAEEDAGTPNMRSERTAVVDVKNEAEDASGSNRAEFPMEELYQTSEPQHHKATKRQLFACVHCLKTFQYNKTFEEHQQEHIGKPQLLTCGTCQRQFTSRSALVNHTRAHKNGVQKKTNFPCETCGKVFNHRGNLNVHLRIHTGEEPYVCEHCGKGYKRCGELNVHRRLHTGEQPYSCSICNKRFRQKVHLEGHTRRHLNIKLFECKECGKTFVERCHYTRHMRVHTGERPYKCSLCSKTFAGKGNLNVHMFTHSRDPKQISQCEVCGDSFQTTYINSHMRTHTRERPFKCGYCEKTFIQATHRKNHEVTHTGEYPYNCNECGKGYCGKRNLIKHIQTHGN